MSTLISQTQINDLLTQTMTQYFDEYDQIWIPRGCIQDYGTPSKFLPLMEYLLCRAPGWHTDIAYAYLTYDRTVFPDQNGDTRDVVCIARMAAQGAYETCSQDGCERWAEDELMTHDIECEIGMDRLASFYVYFWLRDRCGLLVDDRLYRLFPAFFHSVRINGSSFWTGDEEEFHDLIRDRLWFDDEEDDEGVYSDVEATSGRDDTETEALIAKLSVQQYSYKQKRALTKIQINKKERKEQRYQSMAFAKKVAKQSRQVMRDIKVQDIEPTAFEDLPYAAQSVLSFGWSGYTLYKSMRNAANQSADPESIAQSLILSLVSVYRDRSMTNIVIQIAQFFNLCGFKLVSAVSALISILVPVLKKTIHYVDDIITPCSTQSQQVESDPVKAEATALEMPDIGSLMAEVAGSDHLSVIAGLVGASVVIISSLILGNSALSTSKKSLTFAEKFAKVGKTMSDGKNGIYAVIAMTRDLSSWIKETVEGMVMDSPKFALFTEIKKCSVEDTELLKKEDFLELYTSLLDPSNRDRLTCNIEWKDKLHFVYSILQEIQDKIVTGKLILPLVASQKHTLMLSEIQKIRKIALKFGNAEASRIEPLWIYISGEAGTGKSQFTTWLARTMIEALRPKAQEIGLPPGDSVFSVNFAEKYLTGYRQQFCVVVDDIFQDREGQTDVSSALSLINWISNVPHTTNQAALDEKGIQFESKLLITSSNVEVPHRQEINFQEALHRRMRIRLRMVPLAEEEENDPYLKRGVGLEFQERRISAMNFASYCLDQFMIHYRHQRHLMETRIAEEEDLAQLRDQVEATSGKDFLVRWAAWSIAGMTFNWLTSVPLNESRFMTDDDYAMWHCVHNSWVAMTMVKRKIMTRPPDNLRYFAPGEAQHRGPIEVEVFVKTMGRLPTIVPNMSKYAIRVDRICDQWNSFIEEVARNAAEKHEVVPDMDPMAVLDVKGMNYITELVSSYKKMFNDIWSFITGSWWGKVLAALGTAYLMYSAYHWMNPAAEVAEETGVKYDFARPARTRVLRSPVRITPTDGVALHQEMAREIDIASNEFDFNTMDVLSKLLLSRGSICRIRCNGVVAVATRICGTFILVNKHFISMCKDKDPISIEIDTKDGQKVVNEVFNPKRGVQITGKDLYVYKCSYNMPQARDITCHFQDDDMKVMTTNAVLGSSYPAMSFYCNIVAEPINRKVIYSKQDEEFTMTTGFRSKVPVTPGMSGSLLVAFNNNIQKKILGVQVARSQQSKEAFFEVVAKSELDDAMKHLGAEKPIVPPVEDAVEACCVEEADSPPNLPSNSLIHLGKIAPQFVMRPAAGSKLQKSLIFDENVSTMQPACLSGNDKRLDESIRGKVNLSYIQMEGFNRVYGSIDTELNDLVVEQLKNEYSSKIHSNTIPRRRLTENEIVNGVPGVYKSLDMDTSPGFPYVKQRKITSQSGKHEWFTEHQDKDGKKWYTMKDDLRDGLEQKRQMMKRGERPLNIGYVCLKDEKRSLEKVRLGKTRAFICMPMDYNMLIREYFGLFVATQQATVTKHANCVGVNPAEMWTSIANELWSRGLKLEDFDFKQYDSSLMAQFFMDYADIVSHWYGDKPGSESWNVRRVLMHDMAFTIIIVGDQLFMKTGGSVSGSAVTANINCDIQDHFMSYVWHKLCLRPEFQEYAEQHDLFSLKAFRDHVAMFLYGDDHIHSKSQLAEGLFAGERIREEVNILGMDITAADKTLNFRQKTIEEVTFLKRSFVQDGFRWRCPLDANVIREIPMWIHKCDDPYTATVVNADMSLLESYMHGKEFYQEQQEYLQSALRDASDKLGTPMMVTLSWSQLDRKYRQGQLELLGSPSSFM